jgi:hypothetical protein
MTIIIFEVLKNIIIYIYMGYKKGKSQTLVVGQPTHYA